MSGKPESPVKPAASGTENHRKGVGMMTDNRYGELMGLPHHVSEKRPQMSMLERAAQFAPFAALTGYGSAIKETERMTDRRIELDENALTVLDMKLSMLADRLDKVPELSFTVFRPDGRKEGGAYLTVKGCVRRIDELERLIMMQDGTKLAMDDIVDISGDLFSTLE